MIEKLKTFTFYLVVGYALAAISLWLKSPFLNEFLSKNLVTILIALMAINTTTRGVIMTKLKEIADETNADFSPTIRELRVSLLEQIWYIVIAVSALMLRESQRLGGLIPYADLTIGGIIAAVFVASMMNLYDTAQSIFVILRYENKRK